MAFVATAAICQTPGQAGGETVTLAATDHAFDSANPILDHAFFVLLQLTLDLLGIIGLGVNGQTIDFH